jgi:type I restriction enzyme S subunit
MKDSGIKWLGRVPAHWRVAPIKRVVSIPVTDGPHETPDFFDEGVPFASAEAVSNGTLDFSKVRGYISREEHERYAQKYVPRRGDIYMVKSGATTGVTAIVDTDLEFNIWSPLAAIRCGEGILPAFLLNFMRSRNFLDAVTLNWSFGTQQNIGMSVIENLAVPVPPPAEQEQIKNSLHRVDIETSALVGECERAVDLLKERRSALISAAVTGKIDVRCLAA